MKHAAPCHEKQSAVIRFPLPAHAGVGKLIDRCILPFLSVHAL